MAKRNSDTANKAAKPFVRTKGPKPTWTDTEKKQLVSKARQLKKKLGRPLRPADFRSIAIKKRSYFSVKSQAARLGLYEPTRKTQRWTEREEQMLLLLAKKRKLGARAIKERGFFCESEEASKFWAERSLDSIAQKKRRHGLVDTKRSWRAKYAKRLTDAERKKLRRDLEKNKKKKSTDDFAQEYGVSSSTIRRYRQQWGIEQSWQDSMNLPSSLEKRKVLVEQTRQRNRTRWRREKADLLRNLERRKKLLETKAANGGKEVVLRTCEGCGRSWPETDAFFARSPKRRNGKIVRHYLRRRCRVCPRRQVG